MRPFLLVGHRDPRDNGAVLNIAKTLKNTMSSAAKAEIGVMLLNSRQAIPAKTTMIEMS